jgi:hypothetical protein
LVLFYWDQEPSGSSQGECAGVRLGDSLLLAPRELGEFTFTAADEADFADFVACITDGQDQWMSSGFDAGTTASGDNWLETELWHGARDLSGVAVLYARLVVEEHTQMPTSEGTPLELSWRWELHGY